MMDLVVIGGGITGLGLARLAARNRFKVSLLERGDLASGTSSQSSHMLHGGLRYLEHGRLGQVRESLRERQEVSRLAPDYASTCRFLVPLYRGGRMPPWKLRTGLSLYDLLAGHSHLARHEMVGAPEALELEPSLSPEGLLGAGLYSDAVMDDCGLAIAVARDAALHGAEIHTYTEVVGGQLGREGGVALSARDLLQGGERIFHARVVVNAAGPWADAVRRLLLPALRPEVPEPRNLIRPSRGVHVVYPVLTRGMGVVLLARSDGRVVFLVPFGDCTLVGTTEAEVASPPLGESFRPRLEELDYLRSELRRALPGSAGASPLALTSGLRPLLVGPGRVARLSREHRVVDDGLLLTVVGGKFTTFRIMARDALAQVARKLGRADRAVVDSSEPLPPPLPLTDDLETLVGLAVEHHFARRLEDVMRRRTRLWLSPDRGRSAAPRIAAALAQRMKWSPGRERDELAHWEAGCKAEEDLLRRSEVAVPS